MGWEANLKGHGLPYVDQEGQEVVCIVTNIPWFITSYWKSTGEYHEFYRKSGYTYKFYSRKDWVRFAKKYYPDFRKLLEV